jgi:hypothetical protein
MARTSWSSRIVLWAAVCALVLKAAVPMLAAGAAGLRGVPVAQVCAVYGVTLPADSAGHHHHHAHGDAQHPGQDDHGSHSDAAHGSDHCALTALAALAVPDAPSLAVAAEPTAPSHLAAARSIRVHDASALWAARLRHGPPVLP